MSIDRTKFFNTIRPLFTGGRMSESQVDGCTKILDYWEQKWLPSNGDLNPAPAWLAYALATTFWETAQTMQPITEQGSEAYLQAKPYWPYYGRGLGQNTWDYNYKAWGVRLGIDLISNPDLALQWDYALPMLFDSMARGYWTGRRLGQYFGPKLNNPVGARAIVNGSDQASRIAGYHATMLKAIS